MAVERLLEISVVEPWEEQGVSAMLLAGTWIQFDESLMIGSRAVDFEEKSLVEIEIF
jgi:hypothetical protein